MVEDTVKLRIQLGNYYFFLFGRPSRIYSNSWLYLKFGRKCDQSSIATLPGLNALRQVCGYLNH